ncbi:hypothetical protein [Sphingomonas sp. BK235]|uniref:hypothetical protein n=1 Tax=Sphingomonas sp. BK235 TaxID=2512131 RepID=UPI0010E56015|nr:hypothetical protein [Sphingomonas sp. BK235]TCP33269.1 hypothetical protein EV292_106211 [Sphingomonas sp. BK235]
MKTIKMLVGQEGPTLSRAPGQDLVVGVDVDADEAQRLVDGDLAVEVVEQAPAEPVTAAAPATEPAPAAEPAPAPAKRARAKKPAAQA